jgi:hypothetical protein
MNSAAAAANPAANGGCGRPGSGNEAASGTGRSRWTRKLIAALASRAGSRPAGRQAGQGR